MKFTIGGKEYDDSSYTYLEGSNGANRCNWCHRDNVHSKAGDFPHKANCPYHTIQALWKGIADLNENVLLSAIEGDVEPVRVIKFADEFYEMPTKHLGELPSFLEHPTKHTLNNPERQKDALRAIGAMVKLYGKKIFSGCFDYDGWFQTLYQ